MFGAISGAALWLLLAQIGVPEIFGIGSNTGLIPSLVLGAIIGLTRFRFLFPAIVFLLIALILVVSYTTVIVQPVRGFIRSDPVPQSADAVVALSAGVNADGFLTQQGADRTLKAVELVENGIAPVLLFTREEKSGKNFHLTSAEDQMRFANIARLHSVLSTRRVKSTRDEALAVASIAKYRNWRHIVLVTSPLHSRRACRTFENVGLMVSCVPSDSRDVSLKRLVHAEDRIKAFSLWMYETAGTLRYRLAGWI